MKLIKIIFAAIIIFLLAGCASPAKRFSKLARKYPNLVKRDTITKDTTIVTPSVNDSVEVKTSGNIINDIDSLKSLSKSEKEEIKNLIVHDLNHDTIIKKPWGSVRIKSTTDGTKVFIDNPGDSIKVKQQTIINTAEIKEEPPKKRESIINDIKLFFTDVKLFLYWLIIIIILLSAYRLIKFFLK